MKTPRNEVDRARMRGRRGISRRSAFTVVELLVVIAIIGILSYAALPAMKNITTADSMTAAQRQLIDDISYARRLAIRTRANVYMVFNPDRQLFFTNGMGGVGGILPYCGYAFYTDRRVGDQPGRPVAQYFTEWKSLPKGIYIPEWKFDLAFTNQMTNVFIGNTNVFVSHFSRRNIYYPTDTSKTNTVPYIQFNSLGQLVSGRNYETIPLARGFGNTNPPAMTESPTDNSLISPAVVVINKLSGRGRVYKPEISLK